MQPRERIIKAVLIGWVAVMVGRLAFLQLWSEQYRVFSAHNFLRVEEIAPFRGEIFDRKGRLMATNRRAFRLMVVPSFYRLASLDSVLAVVGLSSEQWGRRLRRARDYSRILPSEIVRGLTADQAARLAPLLARSSGLYLESYWRRSYLGHSAPHLVGYLSEVPPQVIAVDSFYRRGDVYGVRGVERYYERRLRGTKGRRKVITDVYGRVVGVYPDTSFNRPARAGTSLHLSIDLELQAYARRLMEGKRGAVVALDPRSGEVLAMVSMPDYSPDSMMGRGRYAYFRRRRADTTAPLFHRAITALYPPGSILKPLLALVGLQQGVIDSTWRMMCRGGFYGQGLRVGCHGHPSPLRVKGAVRYSCNAFFIALFLRSVEELDSVPARAYARWRRALLDFGIGRPTGIDLPNERSGFLPDTAFFNRFYGAGRWKGPTIASLGIGQGEMLLTPLQMAWMAALLASDGRCPRPHLNREMFVPPSEVARRYSHPEAWQMIRAAMKEVVRRGTARWVRTSRFEMAGKTGTAENPHGRDHSLFIGYAPADSPRIAVAVVVENGGFGASIAAPIASLVIEKYLFDSVARPSLEQYCIRYGRPVQASGE